MAVNFSDPACGFYQREVVDFINKQILKRGTNPHLHSLKTCKSWGEVEKRLRDILTDTTVSGSAKEACAWSTLAMAVRYAQRQKQEERERVRKLQELLEEQKLLSDVLVGMVNKLREIQGREREQNQLQLRQNLTALRGVEQERNLLRNELLKAITSQAQKQNGPEEVKGKEALQTLSGLVYPQGGGGYCVSNQVMQGPIQGIVATPAILAPPELDAKKEMMASPWIKGQELAVCSKLLGGWAQTGLLALNLPNPSYSIPPPFSVPRAASDAEAGSSIDLSGTTWQGKLREPGRFMPERFKPVSGISPALRTVVRRKEGDWDCEQCQSMNFSWRKQCFKCKKAQNAKENGSSSPKEEPK